MLYSRRLCLLLLFFVFNSSADAANNRFYIKQTAAGTQDAKSWENAAGDLYATMNRHNTGDTTEIWVAKGTYSLPNTATLSFFLKKGIKLYGGFNGGEADISSRDWVANETILDGRNVNYHVVATNQDGAASDDTRLDGFTVTRGNAAGTLNDRHGGGIFILQTSPTIANCKFVSNKASLNGGAIYINGSAVAAAKPFILNCSFSNNQATSGGAIYAQGLVSNRSSAVIVNCTFSGNSALTSGGGAIYNDKADTVIVNCTFSGNSAAIAGNGGGIYNHMSNPNSPLIVNSIFWKNTGGEIVNTFGNAVSCIIPQVVPVSWTNIISQDPRLLPFDGRIYPLSPDSPALAAGEPVGLIVSAGVEIPSFDQRGTVRYFGTSADIGAFQLTTPPDDETVSEDLPPSPPASDDNEPSTEPPKPPTPTPDGGSEPPPQATIPRRSGCNSLFLAFAIFPVISLPLLFRARPTFKGGIIPTQSAPVAQRIE